MSLLLFLKTPTRQAAISFVELATTQSNDKAGSDSFVLSENAVASTANRHAAVSFVELQALGVETDQFRIDTFTLSESAVVDPGDLNKSTTESLALTEEGYSETLTDEPDIVLTEQALLTVALSSTDAFTVSESSGGSEVVATDSFTLTDASEPLEVDLNSVDSLAIGEQAAPVIDEENNTILSADLLALLESSLVETALESTDSFGLAESAGFAIADQDKFGVDSFSLSESLNSRELVAVDTMTMADLTFRSMGSSSATPHRRGLSSLKSLTTITKPAK